LTGSGSLGRSSIKATPAEPSNSTSQTSGGEKVPDWKLRLEASRKEQEKKGEEEKRRKEEKLTSVRDTAKAGTLSTKELEQIKESLREAEAKVAVLQKENTHLQEQLQASSRAGDGEKKKEKRMETMNWRSYVRSTRMSMRNTKM